MEKLVVWQADPFNFEFFCTKTVSFEKFIVNLNASLVFSAMVISFEISTISSYKLSNFWVANNEIKRPDHFI